MWIKICGLTTPEAVLACAEGGADAVGFVFAPSRRRITVAATGRLARLLPRRLEKVGVFVDAPWREVAEIQQRLGLDLLQFHGAESPDYCCRFPARAIKAFRIASPGDLQAVEAYRGKIRACLLDSYLPGAAGGTGKAWDWALLNPEQRAGLSGMRVIAAGGLTSRNVIAALQALKLDGVDTSSGVESGGQKDPLLIKQFIETVRRWEHRALA